MPHHYNHDYAHENLGLLGSGIDTWETDRAVINVESGERSILYFIRDSITSASILTFGDEDKSGSFLIAAA